MIRNHRAAAVERVDEALKMHNNGTIYGSNTCKVWGSFQHILERFYPKQPFTWDSIDQRLVDKFLYMLEKEEYMPKTINKYLVCFRALVGYALRLRCIPIW